MYLMHNEFYTIKMDLLNIYLFKNRFQERISTY